MPRTRKQTVDYFPHDAHHGKTIAALEKRYQNDGYAFWFKLLEKLCDAPGHYLDLSDETGEDWEFLVEETLVSAPDCAEILGLLSRLRAIDRDLWEDHKVVWCQNLVDRLEPVYEKRKGSRPEKPCFRTENEGIRDGKGVSDNGNTQSKVKESKVKESRVEESAGARTHEGDQQPRKKPAPKFEDYIEELKRDERFQHLPFDSILETFEVWWADKGYKYKSKNATFLNWLKRDAESKGNGNGSKQIPQGPLCSNPEAMEALKEKYGAGHQAESV